MSFYENAEYIEERIWRKWGINIGVPILLNGKVCMMTLAEVEE